MTIALSKAFGPTLSRGPTYSMGYSQQSQQPYQPQQSYQPQQPGPIPEQTGGYAQLPRTVDHLGQMLGIPGNVSGSQEFCNMILFIAFGIFALFILDSLVKLAIRRQG